MFKAHNLKELSTPALEALLNDVLHAWLERAYKNLEPGDYIMEYQFRCSPSGNMLASRPELTSVTEKE